MKAVDFEYDVKQASDGMEVFNIPGPDMLRDKLIPLHLDGTNQLEARLGARPSRSSLVRWRSEGYPIDRDGPRVRLPCVTKLKKVYTSTAALSRWLHMVQALAEDVAKCGGVGQWRRQFRRQRRTNGTQRE